MEYELMTHYIFVLFLLLFTSCSSRPPLDKKIENKVIDIHIKTLRIDTSLFPQINAKVTVVDKDDQNITNLAPPYGHLNDWQLVWKPIAENHPMFGQDSLIDFRVIEFQPEIESINDNVSGTREWSNKQLGKLKETDIIFVFDDTGSMADVVDSLKNVILNFIEKLDEKNMSYRFGFVTFKDDVNIRNEKEFLITTNEIEAQIRNIIVDGGGDSPENSLEALVQASNFDFKKNALKMLILVTDAPPHEHDSVTHLTASATIDSLNKKGINCSIIGPYISVYSDEKGVAFLTGGKFYNILEPISVSLLDVVETISPNLYYYQISYTTPFPVKDGTERVFKYTVPDSHLYCMYKSPLSLTRFHLSGEITDEESGDKTRNTRISIRPQDCDSIFTAESDTNGQYQIKIKRSNARYSIFIEAPKYFIAAVDTFINHNGRYYLQRNFKLKKITKDATVAMRSIHFETNEYLFEPISFPDLMIMGNFLLMHPELKFEIGGHTDSYGMADYNQWLSEKRAEAVADFLIGLGIPEKNIIVKGYGESKMLVADNSEEDRYLNRRVVIKIIEVANIDK